MTLTAKQATAVRAAPAAKRAAMTATFAQQNKLSNRAPAPRPVAQPRPGGPAKQRVGERRPVMSVPKSMGYAFDAFDKRHVPLDELTAPYTTTNFVGVMEFASATAMDQLIVVCPRQLHPQEQFSGPLTDYIAMRYDAAENIGTNSSLIPVLQTLRSPIINEPAITAAHQYTSVRARLHNLSVKIECLGTNTGLYPPGSVYLGSVPMLETGPISTGAKEQLTIKQAWADDSISVGYLRSIAAASLVGQPATLHSSISENVSYKSWRDMVVLGTVSDAGSASFCTSLEPIVIYIPRAGAGTTAVNYRLVVGQQWCSRHPHNIMLRSTQKQHPATSPNVWHQAVASVKDVGEHMLARAGHTAMDVLASRMTQAMNPGQAMRAIAVD